MIGTLLSGRYRLESKLGSGGMSTVYLAVDETLGRKVAIKVMHREISDQPDQLERFRREARAVAQLSHPNLVAVIDAGEDGGHPYIVFEYVPGETLKKRIADSGRLETDEATAYAIEIGRGLAAAHAARLVHRDVKPQNVLIDADGRAKVTDFGIARSLEVQGGLTQTGTVMGTSDYIAPEQARGGKVDAQSDIYSLGAVLYELLTGEVPFPGDNFVAVAMRHINEPAPSVRERRPDVSPRIDAAIRRAMAKDPRERFRSMDELCTELSASLESESAVSGAATMVVAPSRRPSRRG
jgi:eukaryotic-like serine/threonine-protein kinase